MNNIQDAILYFNDFENCKAVMVRLRWPDGIVKCPRCGSDHILWLATNHLWKCCGKHYHPKFSLKTGTIFEESPLGLDKWLVALWLMVNCKNGISSCETARNLGVTQKTAWFMNHRLRYALNQGGFVLSGKVAAKRAKKNQDRRLEGKEMQVIGGHVDTRQKKDLQHLRHRRWLHYGFNNELKMYVTTFSALLTVCLFRSAF